METTGVEETGPATLREHVAGEILSWLGRRRMSVAALARALGHSNQMQLSRRLNGHTEFTLSEIRAIAAVLRIAPETLMPAAVQPVQDAGSLTLEQVETIAGLLGITPAEVVQRFAAVPPVGFEPTLNGFSLGLHRSRHDRPHTPDHRPNGHPDHDPPGRRPADQMSRRRPVLLGSASRSASGRTAAGLT
jgi:transcriptional regulator with XRE-family HTH domain